MTKALIEETEKLRAELEALGEGEEFENEEHEKEEEPEVAEPEEPAESQEEIEEVKEPEEKPEPKEEKLDDSGYARLRREAAAEKRRADELAAEIARLKAAPVQTQEAEQEQPALPAEFQQILEEQRYNMAEKAVMQMEARFKENAPSDYDDVSLQYRAAIYNANRVKNPELSHPELLEITRRELLETAAKHKAMGYDPIEKMYLDGKRAGFGSLPKQEAETKEELKPDLAKLAANKRRNAGTAGAKGAGERAQMTAQALADLPAHEYAKIPLSERKKILATLA